MQTIGEEHNLQTLFCELRLLDESLAPRFSLVWNSAQAYTRPRHWFKPSYATSSAVVIICLVSLALWLRDRQSSLPHKLPVVILSASPIAGAEPVAVKPTTKLVDAVLAIRRENATRRIVRLASLRRSRMLALREAEMRNALAISMWQSPTARLMQSPADDVLTWLPQLNQSIEQVNSFLSDTQN